MEHPLLPVQSPGRTRPAPTGLVEGFFASRGWLIFEFQRQTWAAYLDGKSGLVHAPTGMGKTYAVAFGPVLEWLAKPDHTGRVPLTTLWITPLRALAGDTAKSLQAPFDEIGLPWTVELRTGDTASSIRQRQRKTPPSILITTPENLSLLLSYPETRDTFASLRCIVVDEWHEMIGNKRGVQTELCIARLRHWVPDLRTWDYPLHWGIPVKRLMC